MGKKHIVKKWILTEFIKLNRMLGGGIPQGKFIEIFGDPGTGKSALAIELSKLYKSVYYIDFEHEMDVEYAKKLGATFKKFVQPLTFEDGLDPFFKEIRKDNKKYDLLIIDTIGSAVTNEQFEKPLAKDTMGSLSGKVTLFLKIAEKIFKPLGITTLMLNHKKDKFNPGFGSKTYTPGGKQIIYTSSIRLSLTKKIDKIFGDNSMITNIYQKRNKIAENLEGQNCQYHIVRGKGFSRGAESFDLGIEADVIKQEGQSYIIGKEKFRGMKAIIDFLDLHKELREAINGKWTEQN